MLQFKAKEENLSPPVWKNLEAVILSTISQSQKVKFYEIPIICNKICFQKSLKYKVRWGN